LNKLDELDRRAESTILMQQELDLKCCLHNRLANLLRGGGGRNKMVPKGKGAGFVTR
jgi:hypothetical protein